MTAAELIDLLKAMPPDIRVMLPVGHDYDGMRDIETFDVKVVAPVGYGYDIAAELNDEPKGFFVVVLST